MENELSEEDRKTLIRQITLAEAKVEMTEEAARDRAQRASTKDLLHSLTHGSFPLLSELDLKAYTEEAKRRLNDVK